MNANDVIVITFGDYPKYVVNVSGKSDIDKVNQYCELIKESLKKKDPNHHHIVWEIHHVCSVDDLPAHFDQDTELI
jgi:hypothetical protein